MITAPGNGRKYYQVDGLRFPAADFRHIEEQAEQEGMSVEQLIRRACRVYCSQADLFSFENNVPRVVNVKVRDGIL